MPRNCHRSFRDQGLDVRGQDEAINIWPQGQGLVDYIAEIFPNFLKYEILDKTLWHD